MEADVERVKSRLILRGDRRDFSAEVAGERILVSARHPPRGLGCDFPLERAANEQALARVVK